MTTKKSKKLKTPPIISTLENTEYAEILNHMGDAEASHFILDDPRGYLIIMSGFLVAIRDTVEEATTLIEAIQTSYKKKTRHYSC